MRLGQDERQGHDRFERPRRAGGDAPRAARRRLPAFGYWRRNQRVRTRCASRNIERSGTVRHSSDARADRQIEAGRSNPMREFTWFAVIAGAVIFEALTAPGTA